MLVAVEAESYSVRQRENPGLGERRRILLLLLLGNVFPLGKRNGPGNGRYSPPRPGFLSSILFLPSSRTRTLNEKRIKRKLAGLCG